MPEFTAPVIAPRTHPCMADHFPGNPVAPGALMLDLMLAACEARFPTGRLTEIVNAKFLKPVRPGVVCTLSAREARPGVLHLELRDHREALLITTTMRFQPS